MAQPGEEKHKIGEAYTYVFLGALEASVKSFRYRVTVYDAPEKMIFEGSDKKTFSFDARGDFYHVSGFREVFVECKGYDAGGSLFSEFKTFFAKAYLTSATYRQHQNDLFWFVANVPFACDAGRKVLSPSYVTGYLSSGATEVVRALLGTIHIDDKLSADLASRTGIFILTDSFLRTADICYTPKLGDHMWKISKRLHGGSPPSNYMEYAAEVARANKLESPDRIREGQRLRFRWLGVHPATETDEGSDSGLDS